MSLCVLGKLLNLSCLSFLNCKMGLMRIIPHGVIVKFKWEKNIKELSTGMAQSTSQCELPLKKNKLDLQGRSQGSSGIWSGKMSPVPILGAFFLPTWWQDVGTRSKSGPGPLEGLTRFLSCLQQPQQVRFRFLKKFLVPGVDPGTSWPIFPCVGWVEIESTQVLFGFVWTCCRVKACASRPNLGLITAAFPHFLLHFIQSAVFHKGLLCDRCWGGGHSRQKASICKATEE